MQFFRSLCNHLLSRWFKSNIQMRLLSGRNRISGSRSRRRRTQLHSASDTVPTMTRGSMKIVVSKQLTIIIGSACRIDLVPDEGSCGLFKSLELSCCPSTTKLKPCEFCTQGLEFPDITPFPDGGTCTDLQNKYVLISWMHAMRLERTIAHTSLAVSVLLLLQRVGYVIC